MRDDALDGLDFTAAVRSDAGARLVVRAAEGFEVLAAQAHTRTPLRAREMHFVDAPDDVPVHADTAVWSWWMEDRDPGAVHDLTCKAPADDPVAHELFACTSARWDAVSVTHAGQRRALPLTPEHLLAKCFVSDGVVAAPAMRLDGSMLLLFGYRLDDRAGPVTPVDFAEGRATVLVAIELLCGRPRRDLDPWGLTLAAPLHPRLSLRPSVPLDDAEATLVLTRPTETTMVGCTADVEGRFRDAAERAIEATWIEHSNRPRAPDAFGWDALYDRVRRGDLRALAVNPHARESVESGRVMLRALDGARVPTGATVVPSEAWRLATPDAPVLARQGEVDGVVMAPLLRAPSALVASLRGWRLREVPQLPVGGHDALHVVWRWPGEAPRVQPAQRVEVSAEGPCFSYRATQEGGVAAGRWTSFFRHGASFGLGVARPAWNAPLHAEAHALPEALAAHARDAWFAHWIGRYCVAGAQGAFERLTALRGG